MYFSVKYRSGAYFCLSFGHIRESGKEGIEVVMVGAVNCAVVSAVSHVWAVTCDVIMIKRHKTTERSPKEIPAIYGRLKLYMMNELFVRRSVNGSPTIHVF